MKKMLVFLFLVVSVSASADEFDCGKCLMEAHPSKTLMDACLTREQAKETYKRFQRKLQEREEKPCLLLCLKAAAEKFKGDDESSFHAFDRCAEEAEKRLDEKKVSDQKKYIKKLEMYAQSGNI